MSTNGVQDHPIVSPAQASFTDALRQQAQEKQAEFTHLQHEQRRISLRLEKIRTYIEHLNGILEQEGLPVIALRESSSSTTSPVGKPGNRSANMPLRRSEWEGFSLPDVLSDILDESDSEYHADVLVERIYEINTPADHKRAKQSLVSTLRQGAIQGKWIALGNNRYRSNNRQEAFKVD